MSGSKARLNELPPKLAEAQRLAGESSFSSIAHVKAEGLWGIPKIRALFEKTYFAGLRKAGMPE